MPALEMADGRKFMLDDEAWRTFRTALERRVQEKPRLAKLLSEPSMLESAATGSLRKERVDAADRIRRMTPKRLSDDSTDLIRKDRDRR